MVKHFYDINSVNDPEALIKRALYIKQSQIRSIEGKDKTLALIFLNPSLRTRISTQEAASRMGMQVICLNSTDAWAWELKEGAVMDGDKSEHIKDAVRLQRR
jgi:N-succinyl-L-ornithine transcarbamylase